MHRIPRVVLALVILLSGVVIAPSIALPSQPFSWHLFANAYGPEPEPVEIRDFAFAPDVILVPVGTTVEWTNSGAVAHTVTSDASLFDSGTLNPGDSWDYRFDTPGTYTYHCVFHPNMTGTVIVTDQVLRVFLPVIFKTAP